MFRDGLVRDDTTRYVVNARYEDVAPLTAGTPDIDYTILRVPTLVKK